MKIADNRYIKPYIQPAFLICAVVLAIAGGGMSVVIKSLGIYLEKEYLPLKKSLDLLDETELVSYQVISKEKIENEEILKGLGTTDYLQWVLEDLEAPSNSAVRYCSLFITYYGLPDVVLHVPEECYLGSGYGKPESDNVTFRLSRGGVEEKIPGKYLIFSNESSDYFRKSPKFLVLYLFNVNGVYSNSRQKTRAILYKNLFGKHSYFCKVEWKFFGKGFGAGLSNKVVYPDKDEAVAASKRLLSVVLPVLEKEHWPVWEKTGTSEPILQ